MLKRSRHARHARVLLLLGCLFVVGAVVYVAKWGWYDWEEPLFLVFLAAAAFSGSWFKHLVGERDRRHALQAVIQGLGTHLPHAGFASASRRGCSRRSASWRSWRSPRPSCSARVTLVGVTSLKKVTLGEDVRQVEWRQGGRPGPRLWIDDGKVRGITHLCSDPDMTRVNRVACGAPEARVREIFRRGARAACEGTQHPALDVADTGTRYLVRNGAVAEFVVMSPEDLRAGARCDP